MLGQISHYGTDPVERPKIGWWLARITILWWLPAFLFYSFYVGREFVKNKKVQSFDFIIGLFLMLCLVPEIPGLKYIFYISFFLWFFKNAKKQKKYFLYAALALSIFITMRTIMAAPYSRSYLLFSLIPILILLIVRFRNLTFWIAMFILTFMPMFYYFHITIRQFFYADRGYYQAITKQNINDYNDTGFITNPGGKTINFPWNR